MSLTVTALRRLGPRIALIELRPEAGELPGFTAGAHLGLEVPGAGWRSYSLLNDPQERHRYQIAVARRDGGAGGSVALHRMLALGLRLRVRGPQNAFPVLPGEGPAVLIGGGIGVTPLLSMAHVLHRAGVPLTLHACLDARDRAALAEFFGRLPFHRDVRIGGRPDLDVLAAGCSETARVHVCGPEGLMSAATAAFARRGIAVAQERFTGPAAEPEETGFEIEIGGRIIPVPPGCSALAALNAAGVAVASMCGAGMCGTCRTAVLSGALLHRDAALSDAERASGTVFLPCVSRGRGRVVLSEEAVPSAGG